MTDSQKEILYKLIGEKISWYILNVNKIKQIALAQKLGIGRATLSNVLSGTRQISFHLLVDIAKELGTEPITFFPSSEDLDRAFVNKDIQIDKILEQKGVSGETQAAILNLFNKLKD